MVLCLPTLNPCLGEGSLASRFSIGSVAGGYGSTIFCPPCVLRGVLRGQGRIYSRPFGKGVRQVGFKGADEKGRARKQYCLTGIDAADDAMDVDVDEIKY